MWLSIIESIGYKHEWTDLSFQCVGFGNISFKLYRTIQSSEAKTLRVCANGFLDHLALVTETIEAFGPPLEDSWPSPVLQWISAQALLSNNCAFKSKIVLEWLALHAVSCVRHNAVKIIHLAAKLNALQYNKLWKTAISPLVERNNKL